MATLSLIQDSTNGGKNGSNPLFGSPRPLLLPLILPSPILNPLFNMQILGSLIGLAALVPYIMVLIKLFQQKGVLHGVLGIFCGIYTFIWGWMSASTLGIKNLMIIWTILLVIGIAINGMSVSTISSLE